MGFCLTCDMWHLFPGSYLSGVLANTPWLCPQIHKDRSKYTTSRYKILKELIRIYLINLGRMLLPIKAFLDVLR